MSKAKKKTAGKMEKAKKTVQAPDPKRKVREFTVVTFGGDKVRVEYDEHFRHNMKYHGPVSETGYFSDFTFDGKGDPVAYATKKASALQVEFQKKEMKKSKQSVPATDLAKKATAMKKALRKDGTMSGLDAAAKVLADAGKPMNCKAIVERAIADGLWKTGGKTPAATMYSAILREIQKKADGSRFVKTERGMFMLEK
ncbi:MAG: winged helix-turn-helix domain-containing protein [Planctomycetota bacterium]